MFFFLSRAGSPILTTPSPEPASSTAWYSALQPTRALVLPRALPGLGTLARMTPIFNRPGPSLHVCLATLQLVSEAGVFSPVRPFNDEQCLLPPEVPLFVRLCGSPVRPISKIAYLSVPCAIHFRSPVRSPEPSPPRRESHRGTQE